MVVDDQYLSVKHDLMRDLQGENKVSLALDTWTSPNNLAFLAITAYVIDSQWEYHEHLIGFEHIQGAHDGEKLAGITMKVLQDFKLEDRLLAITADNASNNGTLRKDLARRLQREYRLRWDATRHTIPCMAHVIQLVVKEIIGHLNIDAPNDIPVNTWDEKQFDKPAAQARLGNTIKKVSSTSKKLRNRPKGNAQG